MLISLKLKYYGYPEYKTFPIAGEGDYIKHRVRELMDILTYPNTSFVSATTHRCVNNQPEKTAFTSPDALIDFLNNLQVSG